MRIRLRVNLLHQRQRIAVRFRQPDHLFQPRSARGFQMQSRIHLLHRFVHRAIDRELVAARMQAQLQLSGQSKCADRVANHRHIPLQLPRESPGIANIVDTLVEPAR